MPPLSWAWICPILEEHHLCLSEICSSSLPWITQGSALCKPVRSILALFNISLHNCLQVIKALSSDEFDLSRIGHLFAIVRSKFSLLSSHSVVHVHREGNSIAHCLAQYAQNVVRSQVWLESVPPFLQQYLSSDVPVLVS
jgi:hypothetical protein